MTDYPNPGRPGTPGQTPGYTEPPAYPPAVDRPVAFDEPDSAQDDARRVADTTRSAGEDVAHTAKEQASDVAAEAKHQAASLLDTVRSEVGEQAGTQQHRIADALHSLSHELGSMASSSSESGPITELAKDGSRRGGEIAHWLSEHEPGDVLEEVRRYARRRPMTFLALCGFAGLVAGRLTRGVVATRTSLDSGSDDSADRRPQATAGPLTVPPAAGHPGGAHAADPPAAGQPVDPLAPAQPVDPLAAPGPVDPLAAPPVDPRATRPSSTGPSTPPRGQANASGW